jgi:nitrate/nitrite transporter NarK
VRRILRHERRQIWRRAKESNLSRRISIKEILAVAKITIAFGAFLIVLGLFGYFGTNTASWTPLIPTFFGLPLAFLGGLALKEHRRKHAMHAAVLVGLVGFLGGAISFCLPFYLGSEVKPIAAIMKALMALTCAVFVGLCIKSFVDARRARAQNPKSEAPNPKQTQSTKSQT